MLQVQIERIWTLMWKSEARCHVNYSPSAWILTDSSFGRRLDLLKLE
jgi:hypothetical protein